MRDMYMVGYKVKGIKTLDQLVSLSFYNKIIKNPINTQNFNIKGIYGMNGSGKSGIITSVDILRNLLISDTYLSNPMVQKNLDAIINKKTQELYIGVDFLAKLRKTCLYRYEITLVKNSTGKYVIGTERFGFKPATSRMEAFASLLEIHHGEIVEINNEERADFKELFIKKTTNLLYTASMSSLFVEKIFAQEELKKDAEIGFLFASLLALFVFGNMIHVYMDQSDNHTDYFLSNILKTYVESERNNENIKLLMDSVNKMDRNRLNTFSEGNNLVHKKGFNNYQKNVERLKSFIRIFKPDLLNIDIDKKENGDYYNCSLVMVYDAYSVNVEFESTGIKKLIKLFMYLQEMVRGGIVFIDEFDSNLHDVYLCALLEYLMEYAEGQLCFTTHNVGPMDILKRHSKSIDFLSIDHKIYPWTNSGNYSPSKLYRNGMIEGSPFNVDSIDFIRVFDSVEEEE